MSETSALLLRSNRHRPTRLEQVQPIDPFWHPRIATNGSVTLPANLDRCEETHRIRNFAVAGGLVDAPHEGRRYNDSDLYKVLEGAAWQLGRQPDPALEQRVDEIIDLIEAAQQADGYLNTFYTLVKPEERWKDIRNGHELYCLGHLIEAAIAWHEATGKRKLLDIALRFVDLVAEVFGPGPDQRHDPPGHQEVELALIRLHALTGDPKHLNLARHFIEARGRFTNRELSYGAYAQDHCPVREQTHPVGHAVRLLYQCCGAIDVAQATNDTTLFNALVALWDEIVDRHMYVTGGIGASPLNEGFTTPYDLPNAIAYCETCASIAMAFWAHRMFLSTGHARFLDVLELELYNGIPAGVALSGDVFFYDNVLSSRGAKHRVPWFDCSCCPTNVVRFVGQIPTLLFSTDAEEPGIYLHIPMACHAALDLQGDAPGTPPVKVQVDGQFPWSGLVRITIDTQQAQPRPFKVHLRRPAWCAAEPAITRSWTPASGETMTFDPSTGFFTIERAWQTGDVIEIDLPMPIQRVHAHPNVHQNRGRVALRRGPVVYCVEGVDHPGLRVHNLMLPANAELSLEADPAFLGVGAALIRGEAVSAEIDFAPEGVASQPAPSTVSATSVSGSLAPPSASTTADAIAAVADPNTKRAGDGAGEPSSPIAITAIPYAYWDHRGAGEMVVWLPEQQ